MEVDQSGQIQIVTINIKLSITQRHTIGITIGHPGVAEHLDNESNVMVQGDAGIATYNELRAGISSRSKEYRQLYRTLNTSTSRTAIELAAKKFIALAISWHPTTAGVPIDEVYIDKSGSKWVSIKRGCHPDLLKLP